MTKRSFPVTLLILFTATLILILPASGFSQAQKAGKPDAPAAKADTSAQADQCSLRVEITNPGSKKEVSTNDVACNKITWGPTTGGNGTVAGALTKKECLDDRARIGKVKMQKDGKTGQTTKSCYVQQFARADLSASRNQSGQPQGNQQKQQTPPNQQNQQK